MFMIVVQMDAIEVAAERSVSVLRVEAACTGGRLGVHVVS